MITCASRKDTHTLQNHEENSLIIRILYSVILKLSFWFDCHKSLNKEM